MLNHIVFTRHPGITDEPAGVSITVDGEPLSLDQSLQIRRHSPTGFEFGYGGSGPAQSALAIVLHVLGRRNATSTWPGGDAERVYQDFKRAFIVGLDVRARRASFDVDVSEWVEQALLDRVA